MPNLSWTDPDIKLDAKLDIGKEFLTDTACSSVCRAKQLRRGMTKCRRKTGAHISPVWQRSKTVVMYTEMRWKGDVWRCSEIHPNKPGSYNQD